MKIISTVLIALSALMLGCQADPSTQRDHITSKSLWQPVQLIQSWQASIEAPHGRAYQIMVTTIGEQPAHGYPVLFVLDGNAYFATASQVARTLYERPNQAVRKSMMIVGIGYPQTQSFHRQARAMDYTPPSMQYHTTDADEIGGAERFYQMIESRFISTIEQHWRLNKRHRGLFGHSYGGLFGLYTLIHHPQSFGYYYLASPSLWWNQGQIIKDLPRLSTEVVDQSVHQILVTVGELEDGKRRFDFDASQNLPLSDPSAESLHYYLKDRLGNTIVDYQLNGAHNHGMNAYPSLARAVDLFYQSCLADEGC